MKERLNTARPPGRAFVLIELLIVIAIILVLIALLLGGLTHVKARGQDRKSVV